MWYIRMTVAVLVMAIGGCASGIGRLKGEDSAQRYVDYAGAPVEQFTAFNINGWTPVSRNQLVIWTGVNEAWLVTVWDSCRDLQFANVVGVQSTGSAVSRFDSIRVGRDRCPISEIRPVDIRQMKAERAAITNKP